MAVHRVICRWDFKLNAALMDRPGALCASLGGDWPELNEDPIKRQFNLERRSEGVFEQLTFTPVLAVFIGEWEEGVPVDRLSTFGRLNNLFADLEKIRSFGDIKELRRSGLRFYELDRVAPDLEPSIDGTQVLLPTVLQSSCNRVEGPLQRAIGGIKDASVRLIGSHEDGVSYVLQYGPFNDEEKEKFFSKIAEEWVSPTDYDFMLDADFSELNFELSVGISKWANPIFRKLSETSKLIKKEMGECRVRD